MTQCRHSTAHLFTVGLSRGFTVRTSLYFYLRTAFRESNLRNPHPVISCTDRLHRVSLKSDNKCSKSAYVQGFTHVPNCTTASIRLSSLTRVHSKFSYAYRVPNSIESGRRLRKKRGKIFVYTRN